jgi:hypothetical protein
VRRRVEHPYHASTEKEEYYVLGCNAVWSSISLQDYIALHYRPATFNQCAAGVRGKFKEKRGKNCGIKKITEVNFRSIVYLFLKGQ